MLLIEFPMSPRTMKIEKWRIFLNKQRLSFYVVTEVVVCCQSLWLSLALDLYFRMQIPLSHVEGPISSIVPSGSWYCILWPGNHVDNVKYFQNPSLLIQANGIFWDRPPSQPI